ncbi:uncharacterized protein EV420DRAFT_1260725 [Desarmillaria tabescens]|uniref:Uncharacterized protein n=1 Tax=Armillaria tabescens TaxID=1929756 RepID=A0AA39NKV9_ARMTA|nr:uncharacterized protein EV420DRAFT_1260725 [Desarmillaria tabescens]KAK0467348.1 hypothetical protein EV420DRAFT_1260725 [Desarmillaria tabescens]
MVSSSLCQYDTHDPWCLHMSVCLISKKCHIANFHRWEFIILFKYDWKQIVRAKAFRWPMLFYFCNWYFLLFSLIGVFDIYFFPINCQVLYIFNQVSPLYDSSTVLKAQNRSLEMHLFAIWGFHHQIVIPISILILAHWSLLLHSMIVFILTGNLHHSNKMLAATFIYTLSFDFLILLLTGCKLHMKVPGNIQHSEIIQLVFIDGLIFLVTFVVNVIAVISVFMLLNLNAVMSIIASVLVATLSMVCAKYMHPSLSSRLKLWPRLSLVEQCTV